MMASNRSDPSEACVDASLAVGDPFGDREEVHKSELIDLLPPIYDAPDTAEKVFYGVGTPEPFTDPARLGADVANERNVIFFVAISNECGEWFEGNLDEHQADRFRQNVFVLLPALEYKLKAVKFYDGPPPLPNPDRCESNSELAARCGVWCDQVEKAAKSPLRPPLSPQALAILRYLAKQPTTLTQERITSAGRGIPAHPKTVSKALKDLRDRGLCSGGTRPKPGVAITKEGKFFAADAANPK